MSRRVNFDLRVCATAVLGLLFLSSLPAAAQTTVVLDAPNTEVTDTFIRAGSYASTVYNTNALVTKANANTSNVRRALLKFDTETRIPRGADIESARLTLTLKRSDPQTRRIGVYRITTSFQEADATWYTRKAGYRWTSAGGDLSSRIAEFSIGTTVGSRVTVDVTSLVRATVRGDYGSRYSRIALVDIGSASDTSYKEFHSSEASDPAVRPVLRVTYAGADEPAPAPTGSTLRVLHWNTHYGVGTDGRYDLDRIATHIARFNPDVISLNEVTRNSHYNTNDDQVARYASLLRSKTGRTWYYTYRTDNGAARGVGNAVLSRFPISSTAHCQVSTRRVAVKASVTVNGRLVNAWSTHLDSADGNSLRLTEVRALLSCLNGFAEQKIVAGDFNAQSTSTEIGIMKQLYYDGWAEASADGDAVDYPGNTRFGATRNTRIDYVFFSERASALTLQRAQVYDTRDANNVMPSDHKPLMLTFTVR